MLTLNLSGLSPSSLDDSLCDIKRLAELVTSYLAEVERLAKCQFSKKTLVIEGSEDDLRFSALGLLGDKAIVCICYPDTMPQYVLIAPSASPDILSLDKAVATLKASFADSGHVSESETLLSRLPFYL